MIFKTLRTIFPTVVSDGWAAVILLPSLRIISMRSPALVHRACAVILRSKAAVSLAVSPDPRRGPVPLPPRFSSAMKASVRSDKSVSLSAPGIFSMCCLANRTAFSHSQL
uniref:Uncharacterized protein n=1 Tax=Anguilla anguilla TaxID=7936 RepID=A0A0E9XCD1_ANGAN